MRNKRNWIIGLLLVVVIAAGIVALRQFQVARSEADQANFQTVRAGRSDLLTTVGATGTVRSNQGAVLAWQTTGTVGDVLAAAGDQVTKGQELASLAQSSLPQNVILAQAELVEARKALEDLRNSGLQQAQARQALEDAEKAQEDLLKPELTQAQALEQIATAEKAVEQAENELRWSKSPASQAYIDEAQAEVVLAKDALDEAKEKFGPYSGKPEDNVERARLQANLSAAQQRYDATVRNLNSLQGTASESDIALREANLLKAQANLEEAQRQWERLKNGPTEAEIALAEATVADARREWERWKDGPSSDDLAAAEARVAAAEATIELAHLVAPFDGRITEAAIKPGDQATPGTVAFRIDDLSRLLVDVQVSEVDINRVQVGQNVALTFDAILGEEYTGQVSEVALVGTSNQGVVDFVVTVELADTNGKVKPGMTAAVNIQVSQLQDVLVVPNRAVRVLEGQRVVYVLSNGLPEPVEVELGASSELESEVTGGDLKEGDLIVLNPPTVFEQNGPPPFVRN